MDEELKDENIPAENEDIIKKEEHKTIHIHGMYENWFLDYASYVILERAVPDIKDGLKPVHRRILHALRELDDGRYNKVANVIGHTMKYHPHGDASIGDALVQLGQKELLIDTQGNWGNVPTGDSAAAPRYIEARLSKFALEVLFNPKTTEWKASYDGRNKEPLALPVKFPLLLAQGVEGIAVGLASKILPHNFVELIDASINHLQGKGYELFPDFPTGGMIDVSKYNDGLRGGKIRIRAKINQIDKRTLAINEVPFGKTTSSLIDSILSANDKGKIKISKIEDNTAENVEVLIHLPAKISPDVTIDALYAFSDCEISVSPNSCVIDTDKPRFVGVKEMLAISVENTVNLLRRELEIRLEELEESWHLSSLERIFIEEKIFLDIQECSTLDEIIEVIDKRLNPFKKLFKREITREDMAKLIEIKIRRITKYDKTKADEYIKGIEGEMDEVKNHLEHIIEYAINYYRQIKKKYGEGRERKSEIRSFDNITAADVAVATEKLYVNMEEGFIGTGLKKEEYVCLCSDIDDVIVFKKNGTFVVVKVSAKTFVGKDIEYVNVFKRNDERTIYNMIYCDGPEGKSLAKRFAVTSVTRDKEYSLTKGTKGSEILYFRVAHNGEAETVNVKLRPRPKLKKLSFDFDFSTLAIKGRSSMGNTITKHIIKKIVQKDDGVSTLSAMSIWYDDIVKRLNKDERGKSLGDFSEDEKILTVMQSGCYKLISYDLSNHFDEDMFLIEKFTPETVATVVYFDGDSKRYYAKRFQIEEIDKKLDFITDHPKSKLEFFSLEKYPKIQILFKTVDGKKRENEEVLLSDFIGVKGYKAKGNRLTTFDVKNIVELEAIAVEEPAIEEVIEPLIEEEVKPIVEKVVEPVVKKVVKEVEPPVEIVKKVKVKVKEKVSKVKQKQAPIKEPESNIIEFDIEKEEKTVEKVKKVKKQDDINDSPASQMELDF